jgi:SagB-type dehydrogenase family enzyme
MSSLANMPVGGESKLPAPGAKGKLSLEAAIKARRSRRAYKTGNLTLKTTAQLLWAAQGITHPKGLRTAPSAGARYPIELYLACDKGLFHYQPQGHGLRKLSSQDLRNELASDPGIPQAFIAQAPTVFIFAVERARTCGRYGPRGERFICLDVGHAAENLCLQAAALGLVSCPIAAFDDNYMTRTLSLPDGQQVLYLVTVGEPLE